MTGEWNISINLAPPHILALISRFLVIYIVCFKSFYILIYIIKS